VAFDNRYPHRKDWRRPYRGSKSAGPDLSQPRFVPLVPTGQVARWRTAQAA
jgi:hypothetical protein